MTRTPAYMLDTAHDRYPVAAHVLLTDERGRVLLMRRAGSGYGDGLLAFPAGHVDRGETPTQCVVREAAEEIGVRIAADALKADGVMFRQSQEPRVDFFFATDRWSGEPTIREPHKCTELVWADPKNLPGDVLDFVGRAMALTGRYDEFGWDG